MAFQRHVSELLQENGEYVGVEALTPARNVAELDLVFRPPRAAAICSARDAH